MLANKLIVGIAIGILLDRYVVGTLISRVLP